MSGIKSFRQILKEGASGFLTLDIEGWEIIDNSGGIFLYADNVTMSNNEGSVNTTDEFPLHDKIHVGTFENGLRGEPQNINFEECDDEGYEIHWSESSGWSSFSQVPTLELHQYDMEDESPSQIVKLIPSDEMQELYVILKDKEDMEYYDSQNDFSENEDF